MERERHKENNRERNRGKQNKKKKEKKNEEMKIMRSIRHQNYKNDIRINMIIKQMRKRSKVWKKNLPQKKIQYNNNGPYKNH